mmetsp:Transcript_5422/g.13044  ORF Transcript_5422/g.13044 Transcript_5422/m.13044 type:complete len:323 (-) Transcript_5422:1117-2085(-)
MRTKRIQLRHSIIFPFSFPRPLSAPSASQPFSPIIYIGTPSFILPLCLGDFLSALLASFFRGLFARARSANKMLRKLPARLLFIPNPGDGPAPCADDAASCAEEGRCSEAADAGMGRGVLGTTREAILESVDWAEWFLEKAVVAEAFLVRSEGAAFGNTAVPRGCWETEEPLRRIGWGAAAVRGEKVRSISSSKWPSASSRRSIMRITACSSERFRRPFLRRPGDATATGSPLSPSILSYSRAGPAGSVPMVVVFSVASVAVIVVSEAFRVVSVVVSVMVPIVVSVMVVTVGRVDPMESESRTESEPELDESSESLSLSYSS